MSASSAVSCGSNAAQNDTSPTPNNTESDTTEAVCEVPNIDWGGREFRVLGWASPNIPQFQNFEIYSDGENGDVVNDAIYRRNILIEDKYNVKIAQYLVEDPKDQLSKTILAQEDLYDLTFQRVNNIGQQTLNSYFYDMNTVKYIDFSKPWWNQSIIEKLSYFDKVYFASSDFALRDKNRTYLCLYNRDMCKNYNLEDLTVLVRSGTWTLDVLNQYTQATSIDLNGNSEVDEYDQFGLAVDSYYAFYTFIAGCGNYTVLKDPKTGEPVLTINTEHTIESLNKVYDIMCEKSRCVFPNEYTDTRMPTIVFGSGRALIKSAFPHSLKTASANFDFDYGVIPFPKFDENQDKYYSLLDTYGMLFAIPVCTSEPDFAGFMLEVLSASSKDVLNAYYEISCKNKYTYDEDSAEMLDLIFSEIIYEPAMVYSIGNLLEFGGLFTNIISKRNDNFASQYAAVEPTAKTDIEKIISYMDSVK